jgi:hypothetical protein
MLLRFIMYIRVGCGRFKFVVHQLEALVSSVRWMMQPDHPPKSATIQEYSTSEAKTLCFFIFYFIYI